MPESKLSTNQEWVEKKNQYVAKGVSLQNPICTVRAEGAKMWDVEGKEYIDFAGGIGVLNVGSAHPEVVQAVQEQATKFFHTCTHVTLNEGYLDLAEALCRLAPIAGEKKAVLLNSGSEAVENAIKIARSYTKRTGVLAFEYAFHGRTTLAMSLTSKVHPYKAGFGPFVPEIYRLPYAYCYRCPVGQTAGACGYECIDAIERAFVTYVDANNVAALIIEPVQGEGGFVVPPPDYLPRLREICREKGIVFIIDEVQTGFGRTGKLFAVEHYENLDPDLIVTAKSLGAGMPLSAVVGKAEVMDATEVGGLGGTYGGNPLATAAALKVIEIMERDQLPERANWIGDKCVTVLHELQEKYEMIGDVRAQGAMVAFELVKDRTTKTPNTEACAKISKKCLENGLVTVKAGVYNHVIRMLMPLVITEEELDKGLAIIAQAVRETAQELS